MSVLVAKPFMRYVQNSLYSLVTLLNAKISYNSGTIPGKKTDGFELGSSGATGALQERQMYYQGLLEPFGGY